MKTFTTAAAAAVLLGAMSAPAFAEGGLYGKLSAGALILDDVGGNVGGPPVSISFDTGWTVSGAIGSQINENFAIEGELTYLTAEFDQGTALGVSVPIDGTLTSILAMLNANLHPMAGNSFDPYVGAGVGVAFSNTDIKSVGGVPVNADDSSEDLALQGTAGLNMALGGGTKIGAQYRYIWTDTGGGGVDNITGHALTLHLIAAF
ncbi:MAG: outer membrane beta-barrel protein [Parvibaculum sp.]|uniref:outer membrane beta-barrel protein n=1 Tax=Parvibaculum sp. TaxID=2024848 RepID=UPI00272153FD|nr:outer membrane beta-barrel protein [Parvibaculum sp.]MDO8838215.1 outer membrane beta-barrel protein [Parvibaculum sp.]